MKKLFSGTASAPHKWMLGALTLALVLSACSDDTATTRPGGRNNRPGVDVGQDTGEADGSGGGQGDTSGGGQADGGGDDGGDDGGQSDGGGGGGQTDGGGSDGGGGGQGDAGTEDVEEDVDEGDADAGEDTGPDLPSSCPSTADGSCMYDLLSCFGQSTTVDYCYQTAFSDGQRHVTVKYRGGAESLFRYSAASTLLTMRTLSPLNALCYQASINTQGGGTTTWDVMSTLADLYTLEFGSQTVSISCPSSVEPEVCSRNRFATYFAFPTGHPDNCAPFTPGDQCSSDSECSDGQSCCAIGGGGRSCMDSAACVISQPPVLCDISADCEPGKQCLACNVRGTVERECVPASLDSTAADNSLSCVPDDCDPTAAPETITALCGQSRTCCKSGGKYTCFRPDQCDDAPDPNPVCRPADAEPCGESSDKNCCYVSALNQFRCINTGGATCDSSFCFADADCGGNEKCCGANAAENIAGDCKPDCQGVSLLCNLDSDCNEGFGPDAVCCKYPGYLVGSCRTTPGECNIQRCETQACGGGQTCCEANTGQLTGSVCVNPGSCPPSEL